MHYKSYEFSNKKVENLFGSKVWEEENLLLWSKPSNFFVSRAKSGSYYAELIDNTIWYESGHTSKGNSYTFSSIEKAKQFWETFVKTPIIAIKTPEKVRLNLGKAVRYKYENGFRYGIITDLSFTERNKGEILYEISFYSPDKTFKNQATITKNLKDLVFLD
ncbi:MAG: hypothetical protein LBD41_02545 [Clostridiales Family XIII bacterium]|jgi:hypothetical protein|nr:hypothetical protein [Clostridiales Family XIII bacterium]